MKTITSFALALIIIAGNVYGKPLPLSKNTVSIN